MKPIKLEGLPKDPCPMCIVRAGCSLMCKEKADRVNWIRDKYYGHQLHDRYRYRPRKDSKAKFLKSLFEKNKQYFEGAKRVRQG